MTNDSQKTRRVNGSLDSRRWHRLAAERDDLPVPADLFDADEDIDVGELDSVELGRLFDTDVPRDAR